MPAEDKLITKAIGSKFDPGDTLIVVRKRPADDRKRGHLSVRCIRNGRRLLTTFDTSIPAVASFTNVDAYYRSILRAVQEADATFHPQVVMAKGRS